MNHSKTRKKFQKEFIHFFVYSSTVHQLMQIHKQKLKKKFNKLSDEDFIKAIEDKLFENRYGVAQWVEFQDFCKHVEEG